MARLLCTRCLRAGRPKKKARGSFAMEALLWFMALLGLLFFLVPGIIIGIVALFYSLSRIFGKTKMCRSCGSAELVPVNSPRAQQLMEK